MTAATPFVGRGDVLARLYTMADRARAGEPGALLITGPPGIGKSRLLDEWAGGLSTDVELLRISGHAAEHQLPFAGLHQLLIGHIDRVDRVHEPRRAALRAALALARSPAATERFAIASGVHDLVTAWAEERPIVITIDDAQWLDESTAQALMFTVRRLAADRVALIAASQPDEPSSFDGLPEVTLPPLGDDAARRMLTAAYPDVTAGVGERILAVAGGLPLALVEIPSHLSAVQRTGSGDIHDPLPVGATLERLYRQDLARLDERARDAVVIACLEKVPSDRLVAALQAAGLDLAALEPAEEAGLVGFTPSRSVSVPPLARSAILHSVPAAVRDRAHRALADALSDDPVRRAWHLAAASHGPDGRTAGALEEAAKIAAGRGAYNEAGQAAEAAAHRSPGHAQLRTRLATAADMYARAGAGVSLRRVLRELVAGAADPVEKARWRADEINVMLWTAVEGPDLSDLIPLARNVAETNTEAAAALLLDAATAVMGRGQGRDAARLRAAAWELHGDDFDDLRLRLMADIVDVLTGNGGGNLVRAGWADEVTDDQLRDLRLPLIQISYALTLIGAPEAAASLLERQLDLIHDSGAVEQRGIILGVRAFTKQRRGDWAGAEADYSAAVDLCADTDLVGPLPYIQVMYACLLAGKGDTVTRELVAGSTREPASPSLRFVGECAIGLLELGLGNNDTAIEHLRRAGDLERSERLREPALTTRSGDLAEALWRSRRLEEAKAELDEFEGWASAAERSSALAIAARGRALLVDDDEIDAAFRRAVNLHETSPVPFDEARTHLCWGERLRRARRKADARTRLRTAHETFRRLGATVWADRARAELAACGERRGKTTGPAAELTPQELQIAVAVARGASNPEVAAALCLSRRTVEYHLSSVYRKLGISGRAALADRLTDA